MPKGTAVFHDLSPSAGIFREDVIAGLKRSPKTLDPKYFYDPVGSALFDAICALEEYYPTRTEAELTRIHARAMAERIGGSCILIEYGSGVSRKTRLLLDAMRPAAYVPIDISRETLRGAADGLAADHAELMVIAVCADYSRPLQLPLPEALARSRRVVYFPGSTIGNFDPEHAIAFLANAARLVGRGGALLIGVDLKKDKAILDAAYDDPQGVTAAFNLNLLARINRELGAELDVRAFRHRAGYVPERGRVEMHLESLRFQTAAIGAEHIVFQRGETIHTENSYKYSVEEFRALAARAGFTGRECWTDPEQLFSIHYMEC